MSSGAKSRVFYVDGMSVYHLISKKTQDMEIKDFPVKDVPSTEDTFEEWNNEPLRIAGEERATHGRGPPQSTNIRVPGFQTTFVVKMTQQVLKQVVTKWALEKLEQDSSSPEGRNG